MAIDNQPKGSLMADQPPRDNPAITVPDADAWRPGACGGRVLLIDDEPMLGRVFRRLLRDKADLVFALGGATAVDMLKSDQAWDLVLCDLTMPGVDGIDVYNYIQEAHPALLPRIRFLSGGAFTPRGRNFLSQDGVTHISKPVSPRDLSDLVLAHVTSDQPTD
jgi:CheY-like chemotaxis protein